MSGYNQKCKYLTEGSIQYNAIVRRIFLVATKQLYGWFSSSVRPVCRSVRHTFFIMLPSLCHHEFFRSYHQWLKWCPCKRSRSRSNVKVTEVTEVRCLEKVSYCLSMSSIKFQGHTAQKIVDFDQNWADCNSPMATKRCTKLEIA